MIGMSRNTHKAPSAMNGRAAAVRILHNARQIWPVSGWSEIPPEYGKRISYRTENLPVAASDKIRFVLKHNDINSADPVVWDPTIVVVR
jgi:hypothetical protein